MKLRVPSPKTIKTFLREKIWTFKESDLVKALSFGVGVFIGFTPFWGFQTLIAIGVSVLFRLNKVITVGGCYVTFPPLIPLFIYLQFLFGGWILRMQNPVDKNEDLESLKSSVSGHLVQYTVGSFALALVMGIACFGLLYGFLKLVRFSRGRMMRAKSAV